jgi:NhaP-type Na+/H+ or K+/H+ antiporter
MRNRSLIVIVSILAVIICLIISALLFYPVAPDSLIILSFAIGVVTGVCIAALIRSLTIIIRNKKAEIKNP